MSETLELNFVSPDRRVMQKQVASVIVPGVEGDFTVLPRHAPFITSLRPGLLVVNESDTESKSFVVTGGFTEVSFTNVSVVAERAYALEDFNAEEYDIVLSEAVSGETAAEELQKAAAARRVNDLEALGKRLGVV